jgi:hypothetical protein
MEAKKNKDPEGKNDKTFIKPLNLLGFSEHLDFVVPPLPLPATP